MIFKFQNYKLRFFNLRLLLYVAVLCFMSVQFVGSASASTDATAAMNKQIIGIAVGIILMIVVSLIDYHFLLTIWIPIYAFIILLLLVVRFFGSSYNNARRWLEFLDGRISVQPSELCKILIIIVFASFFFTKYKDEKISKPLTIIEAIVLMGIPVGIIILQPDLSTSLVIIAMFAIMFFVAGLNIKIVGGFLAAVGTGIAGIIIYCAKFADPETVTNYQIRRIMAWLDPSKFPDLVYQQTNSIMAIGNGGLSGLGLFNTTLEAVKNGDYLSESDTDFIFSVIGEEIGFIGSCVIIILLALLVVDCLYMAYKAKDMAGRLICTGYASVVFVQTFINIGVATGLLPNTGLTLPFVSAGLSSIISLFIGLGLVLNVGMQRGLRKTTKSNDYEYRTYRT